MIAGLAISKQLVETMGGEMKVRSELAAGSEFSFTLPLRRGTPPTTTRGILGSASQKSGSHHQVRVLLVEDNLDNQPVGLRLGKKLDCHVELESNA